MRAQLRGRGRPGRWATCLAFVLGIGLGACDENEEPETGPVDTAADTGAPSFGDCTPGEPVPCTCANGMSGEAMCADSGKETTQCQCGPLPDPTAANTTLPPVGEDESSGSGDTGDEGESTAGAGSDTGNAGSGSGDTGAGSEDSAGSDGTAGSGGTAA